MSDNLDSLLKRLSLASTRRLWRELCRRAEAEHWSYEHFLTVMVTEEIAQRANTRVGKWTRWAEFPFLKTIDEFNFTFQSSLRLQTMGSFLSADFVTEGRNLILSGKPGRGKTHLAIAIAAKAIQNGFDAFFTTCAALIDDLSGAASHKGRFREALEANGFCVRRHPDPELQGREPNNICNRGTSGKGVQLELSRAIRKETEARRRRRHQLRAAPRDRPAGAQCRSRGVS